MNEPIELDPALVVAEINQVERIAGVQDQFDANLKTFKLKATDVKGIALEVKDMLGRSEYGTIKVFKVYVTPDRIAQAGEKWIDIDSTIKEYAQTQTVKGFTMLRCILEFK